MAIPRKGSQVGKPRKKRAAPKKTYGPSTPVRRTTPKANRGPQTPVRRPSKPTYGPPTPKAGPPTPKRLKSPAAQTKKRAQKIQRLRVRGVLPRGTAGPPTPAALKTPVGRAWAREVAKAKIEAARTYGPPTRFVGPPTPRKANVPTNPFAQHETLRKWAIQASYLDDSGMRRRKSSSVSPDVRKALVRAGYLRKSDPLLGGPKYFLTEKAGGKEFKNQEKLLNPKAQGFEAKVNQTALDILEETTRPLHAVAGATNAALKGENVAKAALKGIKNESKTTFSDVLKTAGAPKWVQGPGGFALDVLGDPITYVTFGTASAVRKSAEIAARDAAAKALASGATKKAAQAAARQAAEKALKAGATRGAADKAAREAREKAANKRAQKAGRAAAGKTINDAKRAGVEVRMGGKKVGTVRAPKPVEKAGAKVRESGPYQMLRHVNPNVRPPGVSKSDWERARAAGRRERAIASVGETKSKNRAIAIHRALGTDQKAHDRVIDAIEEAGRRKSAPADSKVGNQIESRLAVESENLKHHQAEIARIDREMKTAKGADIARLKADRMGHVKLRDIAAAAAKKDRAALEKIKDDQPTARKDPFADLSEKERKVAQALIDDYAEMFGREKALKLITNDLRELGYVPRRPLSELEPAGSRKARAGGAQLASSKQRTNKKAYKEFRDTPDDIYLRDVALSRYLRGRKSAVKQGRAQKYKELARIGKSFKGQVIKEGEALYRFHPREAPVKLEGDALNRALRVAAKARAKNQKVPWNDGRLVVLNERLADRSLDLGSQRLQELDDIGRLWDRQIQGRIKTILTVPNPQYHFTNLYGDLYNAYYGQNVASLARNLGISVRALKYKAKRESAIRTLDKQIDPTGKGVKVGDKRMTFDALIREAEEHGAIGAGFIGRDLPEVLDQQGRQMREAVGQGAVARKLGKPGEKIAGSRVGSKLLHPIDSIRDVSQYREDAVRLATYLGARKRGMNPDEATAYTVKHHPDYGDLSTFERSVLRRVFPFWTFTARNTPLQATTLVTKPGKIANVQKFREEMAKAAGMPEGYEGNLKDYEQRGVPIPIPGTKQLLYPKLPINDLNRLGLTGQGDAILAMLTPLIKNPIELWQNYSFFFKSAIDDLRENVDPKTGKRMEEMKPAPKWLARIPIVRDVLGIRQITDRDTGKKIWAYSAYTDYLLKQTPMSGTALQFGTDVKTSRGQNKVQVALSYGLGIKTAPYEPMTVEEQVRFNRRGFLQAKAEAMRRYEWPAPAYVDPKTKKPTKQYQKVLDELGAIERALKIRPPKKSQTGDPDLDRAMKELEGSGVTDPDLEKAFEELAKP